MLTKYLIEIIVVTELFNNSMNIVIDLVVLHFDNVEYVFD